MTLAGHRLVWGPGGGAPIRSGVLYIKLPSDEHILIPYYVVTLAGHELAWGPGAEPPEAQGFGAINYGQMSIFLYLFVSL